MGECAAVFSLVLLPLLPPFPRCYLHPPLPPFIVPLSPPSLSFLLSSVVLSSPRPSSPFPFSPFVPLLSPHPPVLSSPLPSPLLSASHPPRSGSGQSEMKARCSFSHQSERELRKNNNRGAMLCAALKALRILEPAQKGRPWRAGGVWGPEDERQSPKGPCHSLFPICPLIVRKQWAV